MLEKLWVSMFGVNLNCLFVNKASSNAARKPVAVTRRAASLIKGGIVIRGVFSGRMLEVMRKPAMMLPHASRLIEFISAGLFSSIGENGINRG